MALRTGSDLTDWESIFTNAGITTASAKIYAQTFSSEGITRDTMHMLDRTMLKELGIKSMDESDLIHSCTSIAIVTTQLIGWVL